MYTRIALWLFLAHRALAQCPAVCTCSTEQFDLILEVRCGNASLTEVPKISRLEGAFFLELSDNYIATLRDDAFQETNLPNLARLYLDNNGLKTIGERAFRGLARLKILSLARNNIGAIPHNLFEGNHELEVLNLDANQNLLLPHGGLNVPTLDILSMKYCGLKEIVSGTFTRMENLHYVYLNGNELSAFDEDALRPLIHLKRLNLSGNKFTTLPFDLHQTFPEDLKVNLLANPLDCQCGLESLLAQNKLYESISCDERVAAPLLDLCNTFETTSQPVSLLERTGAPNYTTTRHVIVREDQHVPKNETTSPSVIDAKSYAVWIALSAVLLASVVMGFIVVVIKRHRRKTDYAMPRTFTLLKCDDYENDRDEKCYVT